MEPVTVIGAGLAGSECAWQLARRASPRDPAGDEAREDDPAHVTPHGLPSFAAPTPYGERG